MLVTYTGKTFDYNNITSDSVSIRDAIHSISKLNRFVGHSSRAYSVGEHTLRGLKIAQELGYSKLHQMYWLIHDFTEAYMGDCPTPLKILLPKFVELEGKVELAILDLLGLERLTLDDYRLVKRIDNTMLVLEMRDLTLHNYEEFIDNYTYTEIIEDNRFKIPEKDISSRAIAYELALEFHCIAKELGIECEI